MNINTMGVLVLLRGFKLCINTMEVLFLSAYNPLGFIMFVTIEGVP